MNSKHLVKTSKFLSLVLRHKPQTIDIQLDDQGWVAIDLLLRKAADHGRDIDRDLLERVVTTNDKQRFAISEDGLRIRANQGHSVEIDLDLPPVAPPETLYHGTVERFLDSIRRMGLIKGSRRHVHLSADLETAKRVGDRRGSAVILIVRAGEMHGAGREFYVSKNQVWLTDQVPTEFIEFPPSRG